MPRTGSIREQYGTKRAGDHLKHEVYLMIAIPIHSMISGSIRCSRRDRAVRGRRGGPVIALGQAESRRLRRDPLGRLPQGAVEVELGRIVLVDGRRVLLEGDVQCDQGGDVFLRPNDQPKQLTGWPRRLA